MSSGKTSTLKKGQACTCCRRRKTRCDGARPVCTQCATNGRELDCEYTDGFGPTRTEILQEYLARLQSRVQVLETSHAQRAFPRTGQQSYPQLTVQPSSHWWTSEFPPVQVARQLFEIFLRHEHQVGWALNNSRVSTAMSYGPSSPLFPHPALVTAMFLWGVHFTQSASTSPEIEQALFVRATTQLQTHQIAAHSLRRGLQAVQAEILLATYLFAVGGRPLETDYHISAAVRLAVGFGMNRISPEPGVDTIEEGERISVFWMVFHLDRSWAIANGKPAGLRLHGESRVIVTTPWPNAPEDYSQGPVSYSSDGNTEPLRKFLEDEGKATSGFSYPALAVKAAFLCERSSQYAARPTSDEEIRHADSTIFGFVSTLAPLDGSASAVLKARFISIHAIAYLAFIRLHERNAPNDHGAYSRCVQAARYIAMLPGHLTRGEISEMEPCCMPCFVISSKVLMREITRVRQLQGSAQSADFTPVNVLVDELSRIMHCLTELAPIYPVIESQLDSLEDMRSDLQI
ncbi:uncharacterized protein FOMMEDRAFT_168970 [Fomitiporia mediterranea MF3/22]|uniref:uncharacterized protein n=1 Tax=Fomitiporia mediterranea (strain MF3/22) TaxID=694068 RepID=UPI0004408F1B|nr:uncharacterized protein FOMMEDRAFT_168970 [Fomitiporia mediterranea MF3/22]EJD02547.1 hypothetical protein FOMMEDRAFT_168970 [Fomitiporia mediterranea MF3/22]